MVYGKMPLPMYPDVTAAVRGIDGRSVELTFADVASRLQFIAPGESDFAVEDEQGFAQSGSNVRQSRQSPPGIGKSRVGTMHAFTARLAPIHGEPARCRAEHADPGVLRLAVHGSARIRTENQGIMSPLL